jgi:hypothetical protein
MLILTVLTLFVNEHHCFYTFEIFLHINSFFTFFNVNKTDENHFTIIGKIDCHNDYTMHQTCTFK